MSNSYIIDENSKEMRSTRISKRYYYAQALTADTKVMDTFFNNCCNRFVHDITYDKYCRKILCLFRDAMNYYKFYDVLLSKAIEYYKQEKLQQRS
jgi:hypothetical protein